jgi:MFS family permease
MKEKLARNPKLLFWIKALKNVKVLSIVISLFYLHRGLSLSQIFYLSIVWAVTNLLFEIPSSYMADKWGRKKTLFVGAASFLFYWVVLLVGASFWVFAFAIFLYAFSFACFSGTDDALLYDTKKEFDKEAETLDSFGKYQSAKSLFKIVAPILGALIAKDLVEWQF